jgi:chromosomal replication initiation ATPase DnaA
MPQPRATPRNGRPAAPPPDPARRRRGRLQCRVSVEIAAAFTGVSSLEILSAHRSGSAVSRARHLAMYLAHVAFQLRYAQVAEGFGRDRKSIVYAVERIEDARDDEAFDRQLTQLERLAGSCRQLSSEDDGA